MRLRGRRIAWVPSPALQRKSEREEKRAREKKREGRTGI
jgi:hypothetical protein